MSWILRDCTVIGSVCALRSSAPFTRESVVVTHEDYPGTHLIVGRQGAGGVVDGERMTAAEWRDLLTCGEATEFASSVRSGPDPKCWMLRAGFPEREQAASELRARAEAVILEETREGVLIFVVDESRARDRLEQWSRAAFDRAWRAGQRAQWEDAHVDADLAWLTDLSLNLDRVALLALATECIEGPSAAEDLIAFELNSRRDRPERKLRGLIADYRKQFPAEDLSAARRRAPLARSMHELKGQGRIGDIPAWKASAVKVSVFPVQGVASSVPVPQTS